MVQHAHINFNTELQILAYIRNNFIKITNNYFAKMFSFVFRQITLASVSSYTVANLPQNNYKCI